MEAANNDLDASAFCAYLGPDFTFYAADSSGGANATRSGGRADFCNFVKSGFQMMRQGGVKQSVKSGPYKVVISADKTTAVVTYESVVSISVSGAGTVSSRCQSEDTMGSYAGQVVVLRSTGQCSTK